RLEVRDVDAGDAGARTWWSIAITKIAATDMAAKRTEEARRIAIKAAAEVAKAAKAQRRAEGTRLRLQAQLRALQPFEGAVEPLAIAPIDELKLKVLVQLSEVNREAEVLRNEVQSKSEAALAAREQVKLAQAAWVAAHHEAEMAQAKAVPISVFISRKTQRLYARQASEPIFEGDVTIEAPDEPVGTFVFTALAPAHGGAELRWTALAMYANPASQPRQTERGRSSTGPTPTSTTAAKLALDRI